MRKVMTKEVTKTVVRISEVKNVDGHPVAEQLEPIELLGNVSLENAQRKANSMFKGRSVTVYAVEPETKVYEMKVEDFIQVATEKQDEEDQA